MQTLSTETLAKEAKEKLQKKRNLFGLGVTSLIAACSGADKGAGGGGSVTLPFKTEALSGTKADGKSGFTAASGGNSDQFTFEVKEAEQTKATLIFTDGTNADPNSNLAPKAEIYKLTATEDQYDLVISAANIDTAVDSEHQKGRIFIFWNVAGIKDETIGKNVTTTTIINNYLEVKGAYSSEVIGSFAPEFLQIGGTDNNYDMIIRSTEVGKPVVGSDSKVSSTGAFYILWDIADYTGKKTIDLGIVDNDDGGLYATSGLLTIYGARTEDHIGSLAPEFLQIGGTDNNYDMVFTGKYLERLSGTPNTGAIFILWDVADYAGKNKTIDLDPTKLDNDDDSADTLGQGATSGYLAIYGGLRDDYIGTHAPEFLQIGGAVDANKLDMVIASHQVVKPDGSIDLKVVGAIYILWDVADYARNKVIELDPAKLPLDEGATFGSLAIYGGRGGDGIGSYAPEFLQIAGKDNNQDMVFSSQYVDNGSTKTGAIYILWDVADYTGTNKVIDLNATYHNTSKYASSGLLTIYGKDGSDVLGSDANNILYNADGELTNIDKDDAGTIDIAITDGVYTYVFFGDKIATDEKQNDGSGNEADGKIDSKIINLADVNASLTDAAGFFNYDFDGTEDGSAPEVARVGYRFADASLNTLEAVEGSPPFAGLSDADGDLGVWDIA